MCFLFVCCFCFVVFALLFLVCFLVCSLAGTVSGLRTQFWPRLNVCNDLAEAMKALDGKKITVGDCLKVAEFVGFRAGGRLPLIVLNTLVPLVPCPSRLLKFSF